MKYSITMVLIVLSVLFINFCGTQQVVRKKTSIRPATENTSPVTADICTDLEKFLADNYYDYIKRPVVKVFLGHFGSNLIDEPYLDEYIKECIKQELVSAHQFDIITDPDEVYDCKIEMHIIDEKQNQPSIVLLIHDARLDAVVQAKTYQLSLPSIKTEEYFIYNNQYAQQVREAEERKKKEMAFLTIQAVSEGQSFELFDHETDASYYHYYPDEDGGYHSESIYTDPGESYSSYYPADITLNIEGKSYTIDPRTDILYQGPMAPGKYHCSISFTRAHYDGRENKQITGKLYRKGFTLNLKKNDKVRLYVRCIYDGEQSHIFIKEAEPKK